MDTHYVKPSSYVCLLLFMLLFKLFFIFLFLLKNICPLNMSSIVYAQVIFKDRLFKFSTLPTTDTSSTIGMPSTRHLHIYHIYRYFFFVTFMYAVYRFSFLHWANVYVTHIIAKMVSAKNIFSAQWSLKFVGYDVVVSNNLYVLEASFCYALHILNMVVLHRV